MTEFVTDRHLGGYIAGGDPATYFPELWTWLVEEYQVRSVIDVGCGEGHAVDFFADLIHPNAVGVSVLGLDGATQRHHELIYQHDFTDGPWPESRESVRFDLCWSCEFVEHVKERYIPNFLATFQCAELVLMTHAFPGQAGWHHVNCRDSEYWRGAMAAIGYAYDEVLTAATRELARSNTDVNNHFVRSGLAFKRYE